VEIEAQCCQRTRTISRNCVEAGERVIMIPPSTYEDSLERSWA
jgi:hypothetical protein